MASFKLDFHRRQQGIPWLGWSMLCAGLAGATLVAYLGLGVQDLADQVEVLKDQTALRENALRARSEVAETPEQQSQRERLSQWSQHALTPLRVLEASWSDQLSMVQLNLAREDGAMVVEFEASSLKEGMDLHRRLLKSAYFRDVRLLRHAINNANGTPVVLMAIEMHWGSAK